MPLTRPSTVVVLDIRPLPGHFTETNSALRRAGVVSRPPERYGVVSSVVMKLAQPHQPRSFRTPWGAWLAWASMAVPACDRIWVLVNLVISCAMSVSVMADFDADRFSTATLMLLIVWSNRFW